MHDQYLSEQLEQLGAIERLCGQYIQLLSTGRHPDLRQHTALATGKSCKRTFSHLLQVELGHRLNSGETPTRNEYLKLYPEFAPYIRLVLATRRCLASSLLWTCKSSVTALNAALP